MKNPFKRRIYMDHASATPVDPAASRAMARTTIMYSGNPSALHQEGVAAGAALLTARKQVAKCIDVHTDEVVFTASGTEGNNLAILGVIRSALLRQGLKSRHIVTTNIEHPSVLRVCEYLEKEGMASVTYVPVKENGIVDPEEIKKALTPETVLVSVMYANNEIGTIQPIKEIAKEIRHFKKLKSSKADQLESYPYFHSDMIQAANYLPLRMDALGVDLATFNGTKIYGPRGSGALFIRRETPIGSVMHGGDQENNLRPGTEALPNIIGFAEAFTTTRAIAEKELVRLAGLRDLLIAELKKNFPEIIINGDLEERLPNNVHATFPGYDHEALELYLDARGIAVSTKSACKAREEGESHVLIAIGNRQGGLRISLGRSTQKGDIAKLVRATKDSLLLIPKS